MNHFILVFFFFNDTATTEIYTLSLHDALPICRCGPRSADHRWPAHGDRAPARAQWDRAADALDAAVGDGVHRVGRGRIRAGEPGLAWAGDRAARGARARAAGDRGARGARPGDA